MTLARAAFAIPGDITRKTGGFIYERNLLEAMRANGRKVEHIGLAASYPDPSAEEEAATRAALAAVPETLPLIVDGLVFGAMETATMEAIRAPVVAMIHHPLGLETGLAPERAEFLLRQEAENIRRAAHVVVPSPHTARILVESFGAKDDRISIAPPGFPPFDPVRRPGDPPLILSVGLLAPRKGHDTLLEALSAIADLSWSACIVGQTYDAGTARTLREQRRDLGLESRVRFAGELDAEALRDIFRAASVFALATRYEGYGMVLSEAMLHGLPIVSCRVGAVPDTVQNGTAFLVPPDRPADFAAALRRLLTDQRVHAEMAAASSAAGRRLPTWQRAAVVMGGVLDHLASARA